MIEAAVGIIWLLVWLFKAWAEKQAILAPDAKDKETDDAMAGSNRDVAERLHKLSDRMRRHKGTPRK